MTTCVKKYYGSLGEVAVAYLKKSSEGGRNSDDTLFFEGDTIYSYGHHFPLAVRLNSNRHGPFYIMNGDKYSPTTSNHQALLFSLLPARRRVQIPYSALEAALRKSNNALIEAIKDFKILDFEDETWLPTGRISEGTGREIMQHVLGGCLFEYDNALYLSGVDDSGTGEGLYFLTMLNAEPGEVTTVAEAYDNMMPDEVKAAQEQGKDIERQGEFFFVRLDHKPDGEVIKGYFIENRDAGREWRHNATCGIQGPEGEQFVRGCVRHTGREHRMLKLYEPGQKNSERPWWQVFESQQVISYSAAGSID